MQNNHYLQPNWPAPAHVHAYSSTRLGGHSFSHYASNNLACHVQDNPVYVEQNRRQLGQDLRLPQAPVWLNQTHSALCISADTASQNATADAGYTLQKGVVCAVLTADCLPILLCNRQGNRVAAIHAGWRGLAGGIIQNTVAKLQSAPDEILVWLGPCIGPKAFEVGTEVREQFIRLNLKTAQAFKASSQGRWLADLHHLATVILNDLSIANIYANPLCTFNNPELFFSYRRNNITGRMASLIWFE